MREYFTPQRSVFPSYLTVESGRMALVSTLFLKVWWFFIVCLCVNKERSVLHPQRCQFKSLLVSDNIPHLLQHEMYRVVSTKRID